MDFAYDNRVQLVPNLHEHVYLFTPKLNVCAYIHVKKSVLESRLHAEIQSPKESCVGCMLRMSQISIFWHHYRGKRGRIIH